MVRQARWMLAMTNGAGLKRFCGSWGGWSDRAVSLKQGLVVGSMKIMGAIATRAERLVILNFFHLITHMGRLG